MNRPTVLCKIVGVYQIGYHNRVNGKRSMEQVAVMQVSLMNPLLEELKTICDLQIRQYIDRFFNLHGIFVHSCTIHRSSSASYTSVLLSSVIVQGLVAF